MQAYSLFALSFLEEGGYWSLVPCINKLVILICGAILVSSIWDYLKKIVCILLFTMRITKLVLELIEMVTLATSLRHYTKKHWQRLSQWWLFCKNHTAGFIFGGVGIALLFFTSTIFFEQQAMLIRNRHRNMLVEQCADAICQGSMTEASVVIHRINQQYPTRQKRIAQKLTHCVIKEKRSSWVNALCFHLVAQLYVASGAYRMAGESYVLAGQFSEPARDDRSTWKKAEQAYLLAFKMFILAKKQKQLRSPYWMAFALSRRAKCLAEMGNYQEACHGYAKAEKLFMECGEFDKAQKCRVKQQWCLQKSGEK